VITKVPGLNAQASTSDGLVAAAARANDDVWVGEITGQQPAMSVVTMLTQDDSVYGTVR
jgi:hypothetical protein